ncbi:hypothetical protein X770_30885 [Mesorhizobium sp. LSJC269B00]|nr:hypothetical protein X770_30885 [Mesorhizobium sp. LSJC269B00]
MFRVQVAVQETDSHGFHALAGQVFHPASKLGLVEFYQHVSASIDTFGDFDAVLSPRQGYRLDYAVVIYVWAHLPADFQYVTKSFSRYQASLRAAKFDDHVRADGCSMTDEFDFLGVQFIFG